MSDDIDKLMAVMTAAFDPAYGEAWTRRQIEDALLLGSCDYALVGADGASPQGEALAAGFFLSRHAADECELLLLAVDPAQRRRGLGDALMHRFAAQARERGAKRLLLEMRAGNPAEALYHRHGFVHVGTRPAYYRGGEGSRIDARTYARELD
ncbi:GNAT family N-acetyltransferase [Parablastomonas sp. CN1-191]|uniref:GNAT family N-acetyltransferase n=1 Tax=Parablastomonas sp. CN1-191 TaxID=3400908 RepID=UPI003BF79D2D